MAHPRVVTKLDPDGFVEHMLSLLKLEKDEEIELATQAQSVKDPVMLEKLGVCIRKLKIEGVKTGLCGRTLVKLEPFNPATLALPAHKIGVGDIVGLVGWEGRAVVYRIGQRQLTLVFEDFPDDFPAQSITVVKLANDATHKKMTDALNKVKTTQSHLRDVLLGLAPPSGMLATCFHCARNNNGSCGIIFIFALSCDTLVTMCPR